MSTQSILNQNSTISEGEFDRIISNIGVLLSLSDRFGLKNKIPNSDLFIISYLSDYNNPNKNKEDLYPLVKRLKTKYGMQQ